ncbi:MAG TPA: hypothetical protein VFX49_15350 [Chloroflexota bacterium]|nr:hypothetical protein [Chloroflexota bacterium]
MLTPLAALASLAALGTLAVVAILILPPLARFLAAGDSPAPSDVTLLTYGVNSFAVPSLRRAALESAAARYQRHETHRVLLGVLEATGDDGAPYQTRVDLTSRALQRLGVPPSAIQALPTVQDERGEALVLRDAAAANGWTSIVAYARDVRSRRTRGAFRQALAPLGVEVRVVSLGALAGGPASAAWWPLTPRRLSAVPEEYAKLAYYLSRGWLA